MNKKTISYVIGGLVVLLAGVVIGAKYFSSTKILAGAAVVSPVGVTNSTVSQFSTTISFLNSTSTSVQNNLGTDGVATQNYISCTNVYFIMYKLDNF